MNRTETKLPWGRSAIALLVLSLVVAAAVIIPQGGAQSPQQNDLVEPADSPLAEMADNTAAAVPNSPQISLEASSKTAAEEEYNEDFAKVIKETIAQLSVQQEVDDSLKQELQSGTYTFDTPLVVVDPYNQSPLTAVVVFKTEKASQIAVHVPGKDILSDIDFSFDGYNTDHVIPVYGLYADTTNKVVLTATDQYGSSIDTTIEIETEPFVPALQDVTVSTETEQPEKYQQGLNFSYYCNYLKAAFDNNGDFRWFLNGEYIIPSNYSYNGNFVFVRGSALYGEALFLETTPLGKILKVFYAPYGCHHDIEQSNDGNLLVTGGNGETIEDFIYEIDTKTGEITSTLDLKTVFPRDRKGFAPIEDADWLHLNAITRIPGSQDIIVSSRHQSIVARISWPEGNIDWILSDHENWPTKFQKSLLKPIGSDFEWQYNQHAPVLLPDEDNNPDTLDILVYDNGDERFGMDETRADELYTRLVHYRINEADMTVEQLWQYGKEQGKLLYSDARGNVDPLDNGNLIAVFNRTTGDTHSSDYLEIDKDSKIVWQAKGRTKTDKAEFYDYRVERMPIYNNSANVPLLDTTVINLIPKEILEKYEIK